MAADYTTWARVMRARFDARRLAETARPCRSVLWKRLTLVAVTSPQWRCAAVPARAVQVDWSATGAMLGGIGAIAAAAGSVALIVLTWRYVRINADLLRLNRDSLDALKASVAASKEMAITMREQLAVSAGEVNARLRQEHEPFRHLLDRMMAGLQRLDTLDIVLALGGPSADRPDKSWFVTPDYFDKLKRAKDLDGKLHSMLEQLMEPPAGEFYLLQTNLGRCVNLARTDASSDETRRAVAELKTNIEGARRRLHEILEYLTRREFVNRIDVHQKRSDGEDIGT